MDAESQTTCTLAKGGSVVMIKKGKKDIANILVADFGGNIFLHLVGTDGVEFAVSGDHVDYPPREKK